MPLIGLKHGPQLVPLTHGHPRANIFTSIYSFDVHFTFQIGNYNTLAQEKQMLLDLTKMGTLSGNFKYVVHDKKKMQ